MCVTLVQDSLLLNIELRQLRKNYGYIGFAVLPAHMKYSLLLF